jgi:hypothetical protein
MREAASRLPEAPEVNRAGCLAHLLVTSDETVTSRAVDAKGGEQAGRLATHNLFLDL